MDYYEIIANNFQGTIETISLSVDNLAEPIANASQAITNALLEDRKVLVCGNGQDAAAAQLFSSQLLNHFTRERPALPVLALTGDSASITAIADSDSIDEIFSRQVRALGQPGDILLCISSGATATNLLRARQAAGERDMITIAMTSADDHQFASLLAPDDIELAVAASKSPGVLEMHIMILHSLCELIDLNLFGPLHQEP